MMCMNVNSNITRVHNSTIVLLLQEQFLKKSSSLLAPRLKPSHDIPKPDAQRTWLPVNLMPDNYDEEISHIIKFMEILSSLSIRVRIHKRKKAWINLNSLVVIT